MNPKDGGGKEARARHEPQFQISSLEVMELYGAKWFNARPHPGPLPQGEGETLPASWRWNAREWFMAREQVQMEQGTFHEPERWWDEHLTP
jgi:hypothetical protein